VAGLVLLAVLGTGAFLLLSGNGTEGPSASPGTTSAAPTTTTTTAPTSTSAAPETVLVDTSSYIGEDVDKVAKQLQGAGLQVDRQEASNAQLAALGIALDKDAVVTSDPANATVTKGSTVVLYFAADKYSPDDGSKQTGKGGGTTTTPARTTAPTTTAAPTTTTTTTTTTTAAATTTTATSPTTAAGGEPAPTTLPPDASAGTGGTAAPGTTG
jgi:serine/threonine-protein kinase